MRLKIAAKVDAVDRQYFESEIKPFLDLPGVEFLGEINESQKTEFLAKALAYLFPIDWPIGKFYRPKKKPVTMRLDSDVIAWLKADGRGYQTKANWLLRSAMHHFTTGASVGRQKQKAAARPAKARGRRQQG